MPDFTTRFLNDAEAAAAEQFLNKLDANLRGQIPIEDDPDDWQIEWSVFEEPSPRCKSATTVLWVGCFIGDRLVGWLK